MTRRLALLLTALPALLATFALAPSPALADTQNRVGPLHSAAPTHTEPQTSESPSKHPGSNIPTPRIAAGCCVAPKAGSPASSAAQGKLLKRQLASEEQMAGPGSPIVGAGTGRQLRDGPRLAERYGGDAGDYAKMTSPGYRDGGGTFDLFETHWYQNVQTGARFEFKTKFPRAANAFGDALGP